MTLRARDREHDGFEESCVRAVTIAALDLGLDPQAFAEELTQGEIGLLITYLRMAVPTVDNPELRADIEALLHRITTWTARSD